MLIGTVAEVGPESPLGLAVGDRVATLVSLSLTPADHHRRPGPLGRPLRAGARAGHRGALRPLHRRPPARRPLARPGPDGHGRVRRARPRRAGGGGVRRARRGADRGRARRRRQVRLAVAGRGPRRRGRPLHRGGARSSARPTLLRESGLADEVVIADARSPLGLSDAVAAAGGPADVTVVCVDVPGCEQPAILATAQGGTIIYFSMATSFSAAALGRRGPGRRRADAGRQRLRARSRRPRARPAAPHPGGAGPVRGPARRVTATPGGSSPAAGDAPGTRRK